MKQKAFYSMISMALASILLASCTHFNVVGDTPEESLTNAEEEKSNPALETNATAPATVALRPEAMQSQECTPANPNYNHALFINQNGIKQESVKIRSTGYGAPPKAFFPEPQRRLMAMRASKIDGYRSLAERVNGIHIWGGTTIGDMVLEKDRYRIFLDTHIRGARVLSANPMEDGTYETVIELKVDQNFLHHALGGTSQNTQTFNHPCPDIALQVNGQYQTQVLTQPSPEQVFSSPKHRTDIQRPSTTSNNFYINRE